MEKIVSIEKVSNEEYGIGHNLNGSDGSRLGIAGMLGNLCGSGYDGFKIITEEHIYRLLISNYQDCCENWGYTETNDDLDDFIGTTLIDIKFTDTALKTDKLSDISYDGIFSLYEGGIQFVDFETDRGVLQFCVYNAHNGYYGHGIVFAKDNEILLNDVL